MKFEDAMEYHNFYKLCLYYDFMSFAPSCTESFVKRNNDITQSRSTIIFMIKQCSTHILPNEQEFAQVLILIVQASNSRVQFKQDIDSIYSVPESVGDTDFDNNNKNTCMDYIKSIVEEYNSRFLFANCSTPQAKKRGESSKQIEDLVYERRPANLNSCHMMIHYEYWETMIKMKYSFQPNSPTDIEKYNSHTSESSSKNDSANNSSEEPDNKSDNDIDISTKTSDNETDPRSNPSRSLNLSLDPGPIAETPTKPLGMFHAPPVFMATASTHAQPWLIDSGAAISGTRTRGDNANMRRCNIPIFPAFREVTRATTKGTINDSVLGQLGILVFHVDNMNRKLLSVHQVRDGGS